MKKIFSLLFALALLPALASCAVAPAPEEIQTPEEVRYYPSEYTMEIAANGSTQRIVYGYNDQWQMTSVTSYQNGTQVGQLEYSYSEGDSVLTMVTTMGEERSITEEHRAFDDQGNVILVESYEDGVKTAVITREFDSVGRLVSTVTDYIGHPFYTQITNRRAYDDQGNQISEDNTIAMTDGTTSTQHKETTYDAQGNKLEDTVTTDGVPGNGYRYAYEGNTMIRTGTGPDGSDSNGGWLVYTYDELGNELSIEAFGPDGALQYVQRYNYIGTDGSMVKGIPE